jgi:hypothetical protein
MKFCDQCQKWHWPPVSERGVDGPDCPRWLAQQPEHSQGYHETHLAFLRSEIVTKAFKRERILELLKQYEEDVRQAERDRQKFISQRKELP